MQFGDGGRESVLTPQEVEPAIQNEGGVWGGGGGLGAACSEQPERKASHLKWPTNGSGSQGLWKEGRQVSAMATTLKRKLPAPPGV